MRKSFAKPELLCPRNCSIRGNFLHGCRLYAFLYSFFVSNSHPLLSTSALSTPEFGLGKTKSHPNLPVGLALIMVNGLEGGDRRVHVPSLLHVVEFY
jgi:hypothetical protein